MNRAPGRGSVRRRAGLLAAIAIVVAGCGSTNPESANPSSAPTSAPPSASATASPSPSATPSPSPSATPSPSTDVGAALVKRLSGFAFFAKSTIAGELDVASARYGITGTYEGAGTANHTVLLVQTPGGQADETIYVSGTTYHRTGSGPWYIRPLTLKAQDLGSFLKTITTIQDGGVESKNGQQLHHLTVPAGTSVPPALLGQTDPSISGPGGSIEFWAKDDGSPAVMAAVATWKQKVAGVLSDVTMSMEFTFTDVGTSFTIAEPAEVWTTYASKSHHLVFGYPVDWDLFKAKGKTTYDEVVAPVGPYATIYRYPARGFALNSIVRYITSNPDKDKGFHVDSVKTVTVAGVAGRQMFIHTTVKGKKRYWVFTFILKGTYFYEIDLFDAKGQEAKDQALAKEFAATLVVTK